MLLFTSKPDAQDTMYSGNVLGDRQLMVLKNIGIFFSQKVCTEFKGNGQGVVSSSHLNFRTPLQYNFL
jgi:hypothetical protein